MQTQNEDKPYVPEMVFNKNKKNVKQRMMNSEQKMTVRQRIMSSMIISGNYRHFKL
jgi:hypothetical protein